MFTILSYGAGQDSTTILYKIIFDKEFREKYVVGDLMVIFSDTHDEHPHTYRHLDFTKKLCKEHDIHFVHIDHTMGFHPTSWKEGLRYHYERHDVIMSKAMQSKSCSDNLKIKPIYNWLAEYVNDKYMYSMSRAYGKLSLKEYAIRYGKIRVLLGIAAGEESRIKTGPDKSKWMTNSINKVYPLVEEGMDRQECQDYCREIDMPIPFPSNCVLCPFLSKMELLWLYRNHRESYEYWKEREAAKIAKWKEQQEERGKANHGVWGQGKLLDDVLEEAIEKYGEMSNEEINDYKFSHGHCVKSKF